MKRYNEVWIWILVAVILFVLMITGFGMGSYGMMGYGIGFGILFMVLFWGLIIWLVLTGINATNQKSSEIIERPIDILKKRYTGDEISKKELEK